MSSAGRKTTDLVRSLSRVHSGVVPFHGRRSLAGARRGVIQRDGSDRASDCRGACPRNQGDTGGVTQRADRESAAGCFPANSAGGRGAPRTP